MKTHKAQITMEFMLLIMFVSVAAFAFIFAAGSQMAEYQKDRKVKMVQDFGESVRIELSLASVVASGYERELELPDKIDGSINYTISVDSSTLIIDTSEYSYNGIIPKIIGGLQKGSNIIMNSKGNVIILQKPLNFGLVAYLKLDDNIGALAADSANLGHTGLLNGPTWSNGHTFSGVSFDGVDDYIEIAHTPFLLLDEGTISFWFNANDVSREQGLWSKDSMDYDTGGHLTIRIVPGGTLSVRLQSTTSDYYLASPLLQQNYWHHAAFTFGTGGMRLYFDGQLVGSDPYAGGFATTSGGPGNFEPLALGASTDSSDDLLATPITFPFNGTIDEMKIYNRALTPTDIYALSLQ